MIAHPLSLVPAHFALDYALSQRRKPAHETMGSGFLDDVFDTVWDGVVGLNDALAGAITSTINTIKQLGETIALVVRACVGDVAWSEVLNSAGKMFQDIGAVVYYLNPGRTIYNWLETAPLTAHAFKELDKFTGGLITGVVNLSDLPARAMRGDPISKAELLKDALVAIQIAAIVFSGGSLLVVGAMVGTMVGREVCKHQTEAKDACRAAFTIVGAAVGGWGDSLLAAGSEEMTQAEMNAWLQGDEAYQQFLDQSLTGHLSAGATQYLESQGIDVVTQGAVRMCQSGHWVGTNECKILGEVVGDYLKSPGDQEWPDFLAGEIAKIGAEQIMLQWFPPKSKEYQAIQRQWQIKYVDGEVLPGDVTYVQKSSKTPLLLMAGAAALLLLGGA